MPYIYITKDEISFLYELLEDCDSYAYMEIWEKTYKSLLKKLEDFKK